MRHDLEAATTRFLRARARFGPLEILGLPQHTRDGVVRGKRPEGGAQILQLFLGSADAEYATVLLHHIDACPAVGRVHHQAHGALRIQNIAEGSQAEVRVMQVMKNACRDHHIEGASQFLDALDREVMKLEVLQVMPSLKLACVTEARLAYVDGGDSSIRFAKRIPRSLGCSAASYQNLRDSLRMRGWPHQVKISSPVIGVLIEGSIVIQIGERRGIRHLFVEVADHLRSGSSTCIALLYLAHFDVFPQLAAATSEMDPPHYFLSVPPIRAFMRAYAWRCARSASNISISTLVRTAITSALSESELTFSSRVTDDPICWAT